jgi:K+-transporting ATPase ATPase C chain
MQTRLFRPALSLLLLMTVLLGAVYPLLITVIAKVAFPSQAAGSLIYQSKPSSGSASSGSVLIGSALIGQNFTDPRYFWGRPSATSPQPYSGIASGGSNLGPLNPALVERVQASVKALRAADPGNRAAVPVDLVTTSASGLDPDISLAAAHYQASRVARLRQLPVERVEALIAAHQQGRLLGLIGEPRINVLELNLALDAVR